MTTPEGRRQHGAQTPGPGDPTGAGVNAGPGAGESDESPDVAADHYRDAQERVNNPPADGTDQEESTDGDDIIVA